MKYVSFSLIIFIIFYSFIEIIFNLTNIPPKKWKDYEKFHSDYGWYTWDGADHINGNHSSQTNGFKTRGKKPDKNKKIILLGDSMIETSHALDQMPERYLEKNFLDYSVISFGSWGWGQDQQLLHLKENIEKLNPNIVTLWWVTNDLSNNYEKEGFLGPKPTFKIFSEKLVYPKMQMGEKTRYYLLYNLYSYRLYLAIKNKFFSSEKKFKLNFLNKCDDNKVYSNYKEFLKNYFNSEVYESYKYSSENKPQPYDRKTKKLTEFKIWKQNLIKNYNNKFIELNNDFFNWNRSIYSADELSKIKLTNSLLKEIQKISNENNAKFIIFFPVIDHKRLFPFKDDYTYLICKNGNEIGYSNQNVYERLDLIFENIENVYIYPDIIQKNWYDAFDGHPKPEVNKILMKKLSEYIKILELD